MQKASLSEGEFNKHPRASQFIPAQASAVRLSSSIRITGGWLFFFNNQMTISEAVVRQNADATMLSLVSLVVSVFATIIGKIVLYYKGFPKELRPSLMSVVVLCAAFIFYVCIIVRALLSFFGKAS